MTNTTKKQLLDQLLARLDEALAALQAATAAAAAAATHEDAKPENKYDTRGLEASYLAGAQMERVAELQGTIDSLKATSMRNYGANDPVGLLALVELAHDGQRSLCLVVRAGAGFELDFSGRKALTVTTNSPLGKALLGRRVGEWATIQTGQGEKDYEILAVW